MTRLLLVCGDQLFPVAEYRRAFPIDSVAEIVMVEDQELCSRRPLHQQKLTLVLAAMRHQAVALENAGYTVQYARLGDAQNLARMLKARKRATSATTLATFAVANVGQRRWIQAAADTAKLDLSYASTPMFLTSDETFESLTGKRRPLQMGRFYQAQRKRLNVLVTDDGEPRGERWSFDEDNRRALPAKQVVPDLPEIELDPITAEVADEVAARFSKHPGTAHELWLPTERRGALRWLRTFLDERLVGFGTYEDAISTRSATLFHSALSPLLNLGLVTPAEVLERVLAHAETNTVPINDLEGFVRQLIGWREFIRGVYVTDGAAMRAA
ncbi:MAG: cryptochrome/photolyase family protein, partial [Pseudomonadota bacterium]